ncbi:A-kinase anchor protein 1, mitochondrial-like [Centruroides sculpturatus]|uniref:A-kinase anchor protein 1, mitochondrial-like n=1 Tax=Centruroides sculpturatus TaxID=218467 RepID=UPI000C6D14FA|nr:A-kinase anchor protein 1, mitochondrial-like [Centruroides sculpturatus]XP_023217954.1 A-kinase anchor protein 1, mitochondrial-like [Centruroides sculpturatus]XP_023217955.1 A-kinase anchor protein 1, mitochondrial-like [Centruroides sculpturatus]XP_023217956.1 A-kinase anchor protein 1, mitochondrial-like [Centruroides sculpturatus]
MRIESGSGKSTQKMAGTVQTNTQKNRTLKLKETVKVSKQNTTEDKEHLLADTQMKCNTSSDIVNKLEDLHLCDISNIPKSESVSLENNQTNNTTKNVDVSSNPSNTNQKPTGKSKKSKTKKNKRKKKLQSSEALTSQEAASFSAFMNHMITKECRRSSINKMKMMQEMNEKMHQNQGENADGCNGVEETVVDNLGSKKSKKQMNGINVGDCSDSVQSLTDNGSLPHSAYSDFPSEDSGSDSGKGGSGSDIQCGNETNATDILFSYTFEVPQEFCGALIGKRGRFINGIQDDTTTRIFVRENEPVIVGVKICTIEGSESGIKKALSLIRKRFPLSHYPAITLQQIVYSVEPYALPDYLQLRIPEGVPCEVVVSSCMSPGQVFLQQPTHPTYPSLPSLDNLMSTWYSQMDAPGIVMPQEGNLCAAPGINGWYRAKVISINEANECEVMFLDYGGYSTVPVSYLRQIRGDYLTLPFQAQECYLANIAPPNGAEVWSNESVELFEGLVRGHVLHAVITAYAVNGVPLILLYKVHNGLTLCINDELVHRKVAQWIST